VTGVQTCALPIYLPSGHTVQITAPNAADSNPYVQRMAIDDAPNVSLWLPVDTILNKPMTTLTFGLDSTPNVLWASRPEDAPPSFDSVPNLPSTPAALGETVSSGVAGSPAPSSSLDQKDPSSTFAGGEGFGPSSAPPAQPSSGLKPIDSNDSDRIMAPSTIGSVGVGLDGVNGLPDYLVSPLS